MASSTEESSLIGAAAGVSSAETAVSVSPPASNAAINRVIMRETMAMTRPGLQAK
jgi:hypothetical protein